MVVIAELEDDAPPAHGKPMHHSLAAAYLSPAQRNRGGGDVACSSSQETAQRRPNPNINGFSAALSCYPIVRQLARQLDLNTLHDLSRTCRQFRANLGEYRDQLVRHTLHCRFEDDDTGRLGPAASSARRLTSGRVGKCARDMVAECHRCATVVCRNCIMKPPPTPALRARHRRLCRACARAPLPLLTACAAPEAFTAPAFQRTPCVCNTTVWLCQPCGQQLKNADTMYVRAWTWRTRYSHYLGGVGTGAGEGNEGVECGRGANCLAARIVEHEVNYDEVEEASHSPPASVDRWTGSSYHAQEIEGIGGWMKMKAKRQVRVGDCVKVYEDERDRSIMYLQREVEGKLRSWCSWCERVVLGDRDVALATGRPLSSGSGDLSSSGSART